LVRQWRPHLRRQTLRLRKLHNYNITNLDIIERAKFSLCNSAITYQNVMR
jgi:hypothetical protein